MVSTIVWVVVFVLLAILLFKLIKKIIVFTFSLILLVLIFAFIFYGVNYFDFVESNEFVFILSEDGEFTTGLTQDLEKVIEKEELEDIQKSIIDKDLNSDVIIFIGENLPNSTKEKLNESPDEVFAEFVNLSVLSGDFKDNLATLEEEGVIIIHKK